MSPHFRDLRGPSLARARALALSLGGALAIFSCARSPAVDAPASKASAARPSAPFTARPDFEGWILAPDATAGGDVRSMPDGRRLFILRGIRWVDHPDGSIERSRQVFQEDDVKAAPLPARLGGGFVFYVTSGSVTLLWRAQTWTGELRPLARVDPPVSELTSGFDRLYLESATRGWRALDARSGEPMDLLPLPSAAAYGEMVFADPWTAVVLSGVRGPLATFDAGENWYPLRAPGRVNELLLGPSGNIVVGTDRGRYELDATGKLLQTGTRGGDALFSGAETFSRYPREVFPAAPQTPVSPVPALGRRPLRAAVLRGWPDTPATAVVIEREVLGRVRLSDGKVLSTEAHPGIGACRGIALGMGFGFVCGDASSPTKIYAYRHGRLTPELTLAGPHTVRSSGNGGLVISAPCRAVRDAQASPRPVREVAPSSGADDVARYCARLVSGELLDVQVRGELGSERLAVLRDGRVVVLIPPRSNTPGRLSVISRAGTRAVELELEPDKGPGARLVRSGLWLDELWELGDAELGAWVVGAQAFVGVRVDLEGGVDIARLQEGVDETSFFGPYALHMAASASLRETSDYGFDWRVSALPPAVLVAGSSAASREHQRGCSAVGCAYDDWVRVGFSESDIGAPAHPEVPGRAGRGAPAFAFWTLDCDPAASTRSPPVAAAGNARARAAAAADVSGSSRRPGGPPPESSSWLPFQGQAAPERRPGDRGYDFGETNENGAYRAYAWGPAAGDWSQRGLWQVRVGDRFSTAPPWSTSATRSPWPDANAAAQAHGLDPNTGVDWWLRLAPTGELGVLQLRVRSENFLHLIERDRSIITLDASTSDLGASSGVYVVNDRWYLGGSRAEEFLLYRVEQNKPQLVGSYPLWGRVPTQLIQSVQGDELGIWQKAAGGWYVYPLDLETFEARAPVHVPIEQLGAVPPACEAGRPGWLGVAGVPLTESGVSESNTNLDFSGAAQGLRTKRLTARVVIDDAGICVDALAAVADGERPRDVPVETRARRGSLPLVVTDPAEERRWSFRCSP